MTPYSDLWSSGRGQAGVRNSTWLGYPRSMLPVKPMPAQYAGYYADRQKRFYVRSLRRDGVYFVDFSPVFLWIENGWENGGFCP